MTSLDWGSRASLGPGLGGSGLILADRKDKNRTTEALRSILGLHATRREPSRHSWDCHHYFLFSKEIMEVTETPPCLSFFFCKVEMTSVHTQAMARVPFNPYKVQLYTVLLLSVKKLWTVNWHDEAHC